ncbi:unnamed protein product [Cylicocyclus nassatus]|uniref:Uncharacterized protein n=1 Tax=Cylicocyclus nassatus TaxID=53992 RepID=A0AA36GZP7_CYLNA|nr:unnamed protein product [Cylicocyclus nassatus]
MTDEFCPTQYDNATTSSRDSMSVCMGGRIQDSSDESVDESDLQYAVAMHSTVARTTVSGLELLMLYLEAEIHRARARIREYGIRIRRFFREGIHIDYRGIARRFVNLSEMRVPADQLSDLDEDEAMIFNAVPLRSRWKPPKYTFNDIAIVLTTDEEVEEGVVHAYTIRSPAWSCLPPPLAPCKRDSEVGDFQFLNRPLKMSIADDDDERLSLPSTMVTDQDLKIQSLEAQLAMLSRQMQSLLSGKPPAARPQDISPALSDDEGKGTSLCSPDDTVKVLVPPEHQQMPALPKICPPSGPPPPPPPPPSLLSTRSVSAPAIPSPAKRTVLQMLNKSAQGDNEALPVRPSVFDLSNVQLKKTNTARSPGGTPVVRKVRAQAGADEGNYLANALREKFRSVQETLSEHEDDVNNSSWLDDEADF